MKHSNGQSAPAPALPTLQNDPWRFLLGIDSENTSPNPSPATASDDEACYEALFAEVEHDLTEMNGFNLMSMSRGVDQLAYWQVRVSLFLCIKML